MPADVPSLDTLPLLPAFQASQSPDSPGEPRTSKTKWAWLVGAAVLILILVGGGLALVGGGSPAKNSTASPPVTSSTGNDIRAAAQYQQYRTEFGTNAQQPGAEIAQADADIQKQSDRISADRTVYRNNEFGGAAVLPT